MKWPVLLDIDYSFLSRLTFSELRFKKYFFDIVVRLRVVQINDFKIDIHTFSGWRNAVRELCGEAAGTVKLYLLCRCKRH